MTNKTVIGYCQRVQTMLESGWLSLDICCIVGETKETIYVFLLSRDVLGRVDCTGKLLPFFRHPVSLQHTLDPLEALLSTTPELQRAENSPFIYRSNTIIEKIKPVLFFKLCLKC